MVLARVDGLEGVTLLTLLDVRVGVEVKEGLNRFCAESEVFVRLVPAAIQITSVSMVRQIEEGSER